MQATDTRPERAFQPTWPLIRRHLNLLWWAPVALAAVYLLWLLPYLHEIIAHTWWSADSVAAGFIAQTYHHPAAGQYIIIGDHGWFEAAAFYTLTRGLPAHRLIWELTPVVFWVVSLVLLSWSLVRVFGRYGAALGLAAIACIAPSGLEVIFQPTAHTNVIFHATLLAAFALWALPRIGELSLRQLLIGAAVVGAFSGLAAVDDSIFLVWAALPFAVAVGLTAWRGPQALAPRTVLFGAVALVAMFVAAEIFGAIMQGAGFYVDKTAQNAALQLATPAGLVRNFEMLLRDIQYLVGGDFWGKQLGGRTLVSLATGVLLLAAIVAVVFVTRKAISAAGQRASGGSREPVSAQFVHVAFWFTCLLGGIAMYVIGSPAPDTSRYLVGSVLATAALLPLAANRSFGWRIAVAASVSVFALAGIDRMHRFPIPFLPYATGLSPAAVDQVEQFAQREHVSYGYGSYWEAMNLSWHTNFRLTMYEVQGCGRLGKNYCGRYQSTDTAAYHANPHMRTLFVGDPLHGVIVPSARWGKPIATDKVGRLTLYAYSYNISTRFGHVSNSEITDEISGVWPRRKRKREHRLHVRV